MRARIPVLGHAASRMEGSSSTVRRTARSNNRCSTSIEREASNWKLTLRIITTVVANVAVSMLAIRIEGPRPTGDRAHEVATLVSPGGASALLW